MPVIELESRNRDVLTVFISLTAIGTVVLAASGRLPATVFPGAPGWVLGMIPSLNVAISVLAIGSIIVGWRAIKRGNVRRHRAAMLFATLLFVIFLGLYIYRLTRLGGHIPYDGPTILYWGVYVPLLGIHILLAIVCVPLLVDALAHAATEPVARLGRTRHPIVGRLAATLWIITYLLGIGVFVVLRTLG